MAADSLEKKEKAKTHDGRDGKNTTKFRVFNLCVGLAMFVLALIRLIGLARNGDPGNRIATCIGMMALSVAPIALELLFHFRFSDFALFVLYVYIIVTGFWGALYSGYGHLIWLDKFCHSLFGYVGSLAGLWFLCRGKDVQRISVLNSVLFCFAFSMACGAIWEIMEFTGDRLFGQTAQGMKDALGAVDLTDTMLDIICNFGGALVFTAHYLLHRVSRRNLLLGSMIADFTK